MLIPRFEDIGNEQMRVEADDFFDSLAHFMVTNGVRVNVATCFEISPTPEDYAFEINPFQVMKAAAEEIGERQALDAVQYRTRCALQYLWEETYGHELGEDMRNSLMRRYAGNKQKEIARSN